MKFIINISLILFTVFIIQVVLIHTNTNVNIKENNNKNKENNNKNNKHWPHPTLTPREPLTQADVSLLNLRPRKPLGLLPNSNRHNNLRNCEEICVERHPRIDCDLGIVPGESDEPNKAYLICNCLSKDTVYDGKSTNNSHEHNDWCFHPFGCYPSSNGKCRGVGPS